jgi:hypothetical protein
MNAEAIIARAKRDFESSPTFKAERAALLAAALTSAIQKAAQIDDAVTVAILCAAAAELGAGMPVLAEYRAELGNSAATWADCATPDELATYLAAALAKIDRRAFARITRKRILVALWNSLPPEDRTDFIDFIEPGPGAKP